MADSNCRIPLQQKLGHWSTDNLTATDNTSVNPTQLDLVVIQQLDNSGRCTRNKLRPSQRETSDIDRVKTIDILQRIDRIHHVVRVHALRQRQL